MLSACTTFPRRAMLFLLVFVLAGRQGTLHAQQSPPDVLFVSIDDLNDWVSVFGGHPAAITPHLDRFAKDGAIVFQNAHCAGPVCCISRSAMLSGFMPSRTGIYSNRQNIPERQLIQPQSTTPAYSSHCVYVQTPLVAA